MVAIEWTNPSVKQLAGNSDPLEVMVTKTRTLIREAMDNGWQGPPFDPFTLAQRLNIEVIPRENIRDARLIVKLGKTEIEYNPNRSRSRIRFSIAHEIAHALFPYNEESVHNRSGKVRSSDEWQLELLCNISAAEILMPVGPSFDREKVPITIEKAIEVRDKFEVSMEAALLRLGKLTNQPVSTFAASKESDDKAANYRIDYAVNSPTSSVILKTGMKVPSDSILSECVAIGFTAKGKERWSAELPEFQVECVGVPPYPYNIHPRVRARARVTPLMRNLFCPPSSHYI